MPRFLRRLPWLYLAAIMGLDSCSGGCVAVKDPCYDDCPAGPDGDRCRALCDERPDPGGH